MHVAASMEETYRDKQVKVRQNMVKMVEASHRRKKIDKKDMKMNMFLLHRWDILKQKRAEYEKELCQLVAEQKRSADWV
jgi:hypothetical protein